MNQTFSGKNHISSRLFHISVSGVRLRVKHISTPEDSTNPNPVTLVFLHEGLGCIEMWRDFPEDLCSATGSFGLVYDRRGYGGSDGSSEPWPLDYLIEEASLYLPELLKACQASPAVLIGHSDGGSIALMAAASHGHMVKAVITEAAHIFVEDITAEGIRDVVQAYGKTGLKAKLARYHHDHTEAVFRRWANRWLSAEFRRWNIESYLPDITCPVLVLQGENDEYGTTAQVDGISRQVSGPVTVKIIPNCRHTPHFQNKAAVMSEMTRFIKTISKS